MKSWLSKPIQQAQHVPRKRECSETDQHGKVTADCAANRGGDEQAPSLSHTHGSLDYRSALRQG
jgi:hypothetical protein